jgi:hypothetical protein
MAMIGKLVSGGQSGVDRAALDAALELGFPAAGGARVAAWPRMGRSLLAIP